MNVINNNKVSIDLILWLLDRHDRWRLSLVPRAAVIISADALLLAGQTFLIDKTLTKNGYCPNVLLFTVISIVITFLCISLILAVNSIANVWKPSRNLLDKHMSDRFIFHPSDVASRKKYSYECFAVDLHNIDENTIYKAATAELWTVLLTHDYRYQYLRRSVQFLVIAIPLYIVSVGILVFWVF
jgi:hypothetical protein